MLLASRLGWLEGFPARGQPQRRGNVAWIRLRAEAEHDQASIDRNTLRRASHALTKLTTEYRRVLPEVVGDAAAWAAGVRAVLEALKPAVHRGEALPANLFHIGGVYRDRTRAAARALLAADPSLADAVGSVSWLAGVRDDVARRSLGWLRSNAIVLSRIRRVGDGTQLTLHLLWLSEVDGSRRIAGLLAALADPLLACTPVRWDTSDIGQMIRVIGARSCLDAEELPGGQDAVTLTTDVVAYVTWLVRQTSAVRRQSLAWFDATWPGDQLAQWDAWHERHVRVTAAVRRALGRGQGRQLQGATRRELRRDLDSLLASRPHAVVYKPWFESLRAAAEQRVARHGKLIARALAALPSGDPVLVPAMFLADWVYLARHDETTPTAMSELLSLFRGYCRASKGDASWLRPWVGVADWARNHWVHTLQSQLLHDMERPGSRRDWFRAMQCLCERGEVPEGASDVLLSLVEFTTDATFAAETSAALRAAGLKWIDQQVLRAAVTLAEGKPDTVVDVVNAWNARPDEEYTIDDVGLAQVTTAFAGAGATAVLGQLVSAGMLGHMARYGTRLRLARHVLPRLPRPPRIDTDPPPAWVSRYPASLTAPLARLAACHPDAEAAAAKLLARDVPDPARLHREAEALCDKLRDRSRPDAQRLRSRLDNLRERIAHPKPLSEKRQRRLVQKIETAAATAYFEAWAARLDAALAAALPRALDLPDAAEAWLGDGRLGHILLGVVELPDATKRLATRLLRVRAGPPPWDLRDAPENRRYLDSLIRRGVDPDAWLEGLGGRTYQSANHRSVTLSLEPDPLEVFAMGAHFHTCLRPGAMNFFSVFSNAADINKRVVYARVGDRGDIVGRCLLALTGTGALLTFEPYCHDPELGFADLVGRFAVELANAMGTVVTSVGDVPTLVATRWYDDGLRDLACQFPQLAPGSSLRNRLDTIDADDLVVALNQALDPVGLCAQTLPLVLNLPEVRDRAGLILPLVGHLERSEGVPDALRMRAAQSLVGAGHLEPAARLCRRRIIPYLLRSADRGWLDFETLHVLLRLDPSQVLRVLRRTRMTGQRRWLDETTVQRAYFAAAALDTLQRPKQALTVYRHTLGLGVDERTRAACEERIAALG